MQKTREVDDWLSSPKPPGLLSRRVTTNSNSSLLLLDQSFKTFSLNRNPRSDLFKAIFGFSISLFAKEMYLNLLTAERSIVAIASRRWRKTKGKRVGAADWGMRTRPQSPLGFCKLLH